VCLVLLVYLVVLLELLAVPVALLDIPLGTQGLLVHRDLLDHLGLPENLVCLVSLVFLVYLVELAVLDLLVCPVVLRDILRDMQGLLVHRGLPGLPENLVCLVFLVYLV
jgi:hypothetical protein